MDDVTDFRQRAAAESKALLSALPIGSSPEKCGVSYCIVREPDLSRLRTPIKIVTVTSPILSLLGAVTITVVFPHVHVTMTTALAACCTVSLLMFLPVFFERAIVYWHLSKRHADGIHVALEYAPTYSPLKILAEDVGLLYVNREAHYVKISGLSYDYIIHSRDVSVLALHRNGKNIYLSYRVGGEQLDFVVLPRSVLAEFKRVTVGGTGILFEKLRDALSQKG